ncbi:V-type ATPase subunit [Oscillospiraceae bacterium PP1C4]
MAQYANAVITKARAIYGKMLSAEQYNELLHKQSVQEISSYLRDKGDYAYTLAGVRDSIVHRGQLENLLRKDMLYQYVRLVKYVQSTDGLYSYIIMDMEIELILSCVRDIISDREDDFISNLPAFIQPYASFNVFDMVNVESIEQLAKILKNTPYGEIIRQCTEKNPQSGSSLNYTAYEVALRTYYFETLLANAKRGVHGRASQQIRELITLRAELMNINTIYRLKTYFHAPPEQIRKVVLPFYCKISKRTMDALIETKDAQSFMQMLSQTAYASKIRPDTTFIEGETDNIRFRFDLKLLRFSSDPQVVFMAFMLLRGMEVENIIRIIEGVRYGLPPERIEKLIYKA